MAILAPADRPGSTPLFVGDVLMQQEKYQHPIFTVDTPGTVIVTNRPQAQPTAQKTSLVFGGGLILLVGLGGGIAIGGHFAERKVVDAESALKLEQLQRATDKRQVQKFCTEFLGGSNGR